MLQLHNVLRLDPSLLSRPECLAPYPALAAFLAMHPDVARNPQCYFGAYHEEAGAGGVTGVVSALGNEVWVAIPLTLFPVVAWLIRQLIDYRRWLRASAAEREFHDKVMDRMTNNADLLSYLESSAGRRLLEGTSMPGDSRAVQRVGAPINRILWSIQVGVWWRAAMRARADEAEAAVRLIFWFQAVAAAAIIGAVAALVGRIWPEMSSVVDADLVLQAMGPWAMPLLAIVVVGAIAAPVALYYGLSERRLD